MDLVDIRFVRWKWMQRPSLAVPCQHGRAVRRGGKMSLLLLVVALQIKQERPKIRM